MVTYLYTITFVPYKTIYRNKWQKKAGIVPFKTFSRNQLLFEERVHRAYTTDEAGI